MDEQAWAEVLEIFRGAEERLAAHYIPILRTLASVEGYQEYECQKHETSTWLRNNNPSGSALVIFMNDRASEAQSLENIFTIDEARLLDTGDWKYYIGYLQIAIVFWYRDGVAQGVHVDVQGSC